MCVCVCSQKQGISDSINPNESPAFVCLRCQAKLQRGKSCVYLITAFCSVLQGKWTKEKPTEAFRAKKTKKQQKEKTIRRKLSHDNCSAAQIRHRPNCIRWPRLCAAVRVLGSSCIRLFYLLIYFHLCEDKWERADANPDVLSCLLKEAKGKTKKGKKKRNGGVRIPCGVGLNIFLPIPLIYTHPTYNSC